MTANQLSALGIVFSLAGAAAFVFAANLPQPILWVVGIEQHRKSLLEVARLPLPQSFDETCPARGSAASQGRQAD